MNLEIQRFSHKKAVLGLMFEVKGEFPEKETRDFLCFTLEPADKLIPEGTYQMKLRTVGGKHNRYKAKFPPMHKGMLWVTKVPGRRFILIHIGNTVKDSQGCTLVGESAFNQGLITIGHSTIAYKKIYPRIAKAIENEDVFITYRNI